MTWSRLKHVGHVIHLDKQTVLNKKLSCCVTDTDFIYLCQIRHRYNIKYSSPTLLQLHYFSTYSPNTLMHLSNLGIRVKIPSRKKQCSSICNHSQTATATSLLLFNQQPPKHCFSNPKCIPACFVWAIKWCIHVSLPVQSPISATPLPCDLIWKWMRLLLPNGLNWMATPKRSPCLDSQT
jgi:hypothetical protein